MAEAKKTTTEFRSVKARWRAVEMRETAADGVYYYAVKTTGIYCRPSCPSRRPNFDNVEFFSTTAAAIAAGYRTCKRCRPDETASGHIHRDKMLDACRYIETAFDAPTLGKLAERAKMSPFHFQRIFKSVISLTPKQYEKAHRERRVRKELGTASTVTEAIFDAGYNSSGRFYADASDIIGMRPAVRRAKGRDETIQFALGECSLGTVLVAATDEGICSIAFGDEPDQLVQAFQVDFSGARLVAGDNDFETLVANVIGLIEDPRRDCSLPVDIRGTAFQKTVWIALSRLKPGDTATYAEIARLINKPKAVRAVAQACGANRLAVAIPCHRVIRSDGARSGYRWGIERKQVLLDREQAA